MLQITIPEREYYDNSKQEFVYLKEQKLVLEHSLISISKWESKWKKPFLDRKPKSIEESADYIRCMSLTKDINEITLRWLPQDVYQKINAYIKDSMTATWFNDRNQKPANGPVVTSELIYYWMVAFNIPFECEKWHLNRLLTLIKVCEIKNSPKKKMSKKEILARNRALNEARKLNTGTNG